MSRVRSSELHSGDIRSSADLRVGGGTDRPADGFSFNFAREDDPVFADPVGEGYASSPTGEGNLPEEGTTTGLAIGFDEWFSGGDPNCASDPPGGLGTGDCVGISIRVDNVLVAEVSLPTLNGALDDVTSLQTGPNDGGVDALGWATLDIHVEGIGPGGDYSTASAVIEYKGNEVFSGPIPEPGSVSLLGMGAMMFLGLFRRRK